MKMGQNALVLGLAVLAVLWLGGCNNPAGQSGTSKGTEAHDHAHHGPHQGHLTELGQEEYHAEWTHDETGKVTFYILDADAKKEVPIAAEELVIDIKLGDNKPVSYKLPAVNPVDGKSAVFEIVDKGLLGAIEALSPGVVATLHVNINGKQFDQRIEEHKHEH